MKNPTMVLIISKSPTSKIHRNILNLAAVKRLFTSSASKLTTADYDELVNAAGSSGDFDELRRLLSRRVKEGLYNTSKTFNFVTSISIHTLCETLTRVDPSHARKSAFDALVSRLSRVGRTDEAIRAIDALASVDPRAPNALTFNPVVDALARDNRVGSAWRVVDRMREMGVSPNASTFNSILMTHCVAGEAEAAAATVEMMVARGVKADARTYDALVMCACKVGRVEGALVVLRRMEEEGVAALLSTRMYVVDAFLGLGYYDMAVRFVKVYCNKDTWLDRETFKCLANRFVRIERRDMASLVLDENRV